MIRSDKTPLRSPEMGGIERMSEEFGVRTVDVGDHVVMVVAGEVDIESQARLRATIDAAGAEGRRLVVDLSHTTFADRTAVEVLLRAHLAQVEAGGSLVLRAPPERLVRMLRVLGLHTVLAVEAARPGAVVDPPTLPRRVPGLTWRMRGPDGDAGAGAGRPCRGAGAVDRTGAGRWGPPGAPTDGPGGGFDGGSGFDGAGGLGAGGGPGGGGDIAGGGGVDGGGDERHGAAPLVLTQEAADLMDRFVDACQALADASEGAARIQARLRGPSWPIEVREVEVARYLAHANDARRWAQDVAAQRAASTITP